MKFIRGLGKVVCTFVGIIVIILILAVACSGGETTSDISTNEQVQVSEEKPKYEFVEEPTLSTNEYGNQIIVGVIKNNTSVDKDYIQVSFTLYDADGNNIGTAWANTNNLKAGGTWKFEAMILEDGMATFELDEVTGF